MSRYKASDDEIIIAVSKNKDKTMTEIARGFNMTEGSLSKRIRKLLNSDLEEEELNILKSFSNHHPTKKYHKVDMSDFKEAYEGVILGDLSVKDACELLDISDATFYNLKKKLLDSESQQKEAEEAKSSDKPHWGAVSEQSCEYNISVDEEAIEEDITSTTSVEKEDKPADKKPGYIVLFSSAEKFFNSDKYITLRKSYSGPMDFSKRSSELEKMIFSNHSDEVIRVTYHKDDDLQDLLALVHVCSGANIPLHITFSGGIYNGKELSMDEETETRELMRLFPNTDSLESYDFETLEDIRHCRYFYSVITETYDSDGKILKRDREIMADKTKAEQLFIQYATQILSSHDKICIKMYESNADGQTVSDNETSLRIMSNFRV